MKKKLVCKLITTLFILSICIPVTNAIHINTTTKNEKIETVTYERPKIDVSLPDVHVYYHRSPIRWATVEFDEPGAIIDIDLSDIEEDEVLINFAHNVICHVGGRILPADIISSLSVPDILGSSSKTVITSKENWQRKISHAYHIMDKVEDEYYPLTVAVTGVPLFYSWAVMAYFKLMMFYFPELFDIPSELEKTYGTITVYQLHVHT